MGQHNAEQAHERVFRAVVLLATLVRVFSLAAASTLPSFTHHRLDALLYHEAGRAVAAGDFSLGASVLHMSPLYCYFLGIVYAVFGDGPWALRIVQLGLGLGTLVLTSLAARRMFGSRAGIVAGLAIALYGPLIFYETQVGLVTLATFLAALFNWLAIELLQRPDARPLRWAALGAALGLCVVARPNALLFALPAAFVWWRGTRALPLRARAARALGLAVATALVIAPVTIRNRAVAGEWVLVTDSGGLNFYLGNGPGANGTFRVPSELPDATNAPQQFTSFRAQAERVLGRRLTSHEVDGYYYRSTLNEIAAHPRRWLRLLAEKAWLFWNMRELPNTEDYAFTRQLNPVLGLSLLQFFVIAPLALLGLITFVLRKRDEDVFVGLTIGVQLAALVAFFVLAHYRMPAVPALILAALSALIFMRDAVLARSAPKLLLAAAILLCSVPLVFTSKLPKPFDDEWFKLGYAYHVQRDLPQAEAAYLRALAINPNNISAHKNLATLYQSGAVRDRARVHWEAVRTLAERQNLPAYEAQAERALQALR